LDCQVTVGEVDWHGLKQHTASTMNYVGMTCWQEHCRAVMCRDRKEGGVIMPTRLCEALRG
jgi:hypothetical protein